MITGKEFYNVMSAVVPLYLTMLLGYGAVRWFRLFTAEQCSGINRFVALFAVPVLSFDFISGFNPYELNLRFLAADVISKALVLLPLVAWVALAKRGSLDWLVSIFSMCTLSNTLIMGIPLVTAMYGDDQRNIIVQVVVLQVMVWYSMLILLMEIRAARNGMEHKALMSGIERKSEEGKEESENSHVIELKESSKGSDRTETNKVAPDNLEHGGSREDIPYGSTSSISSDGNHESPPSSHGGKNKAEENFDVGDGPCELVEWGVTMRVVVVKLLTNPNVHASLLGLTWALISFRWKFGRPLMMENCVTILSRVGLGTSMFSVGLFMASQPRIISCGKKLALFGIVLRFIVGPLIMGVATAMVGIKGIILKVAIVQATLPQGIVTFVFAKEYELHTEIMSTEVSFGTIISLPITLIYYIVMGLM